MPICICMQLRYERYKKNGKISTTRRPLPSRMKAPSNIREGQSPANRLDVYTHCADKLFWSTTHTLYSASPPPGMGNGIDGRMRHWYIKNQQLWQHSLTHLWCDIAYAHAIRCNFKWDILLHATWTSVGIASSPDRWSLGRRSSKSTDNNRITRYTVTVPISSFISSVPRPSTTASRSCPLSRSLARFLKTLTASVTSDTGRYRGLYLENEGMSNYGGCIFQWNQRCEDIWAEIMWVECGCACVPPYSLGSMRRSKWPIAL